MLVLEKTSLTKRKLNKKKNQKSTIKIVAAPEDIKLLLNLLKRRGYTATEDHKDDILTLEEHLQDRHKGQTKQQLALRLARQRKDFTQKELSQMTKVSQARISDYERGAMQITLNAAKKFGNALDISYKLFL
jgi:ribosome-binding protein aMBF1 (putative translation factor)